MSDEQKTDWKVITSAEGGAWLIGTAIGWGILNDPLITFIGIGLSLLIPAYVGFMMSWN